MEEKLDKILKGEKIVNNEGIGKREIGISKGRIEDIG